MAGLPLVTISSALLLATQISASDSILDMINVSEVERLMSKRRINSSRLSSEEHNFIGDQDGEEYLMELTARKNLSSSEDVVDVLTRQWQGGHLLHSGQDAYALLVTKKEYLRSDWCKTEPLVQVVREEGCTPVSVLNHFCYGQCNSFYVPRSSLKRKGMASKADLEGAVFKSCPSCRPKRSSWTMVTLRCRRKNRIVLRRKRVLRIKECKCLTGPLG